MTYRLAKSLETLRSQVNAASPNRSKVSDGWVGDAAHASRSSDHNPWVKDGKVGVVTALDITHDPAHGIDSERLAEALRKSKDSRIKYIISNKKIASADKDFSWRKYTGSNLHSKHVHISVKSSKALYDLTEPWTIDLNVSAQQQAEAPARILPTLKIGASGDAVKELQMLLDGILIDGDFGPITKKAVVAFQKSKGLVADGVVGPYTWDALKEKQNV